MKKTVNINLNGIPFIIDEDAYFTLRNYLEEIKIRLDGTEERETLEDIEARIADIFKDSTTPSSSVISIGLVKRAITIIGNANEFGEPKRTFYKEGEQPEKEKLYRSRDEKIIAGVCGGLAEYFGLDITLTRVVTFILLFFGGVSLWVYIILWIVVPLRPRKQFNINNNKNTYTY